MNAVLPRFHYKRDGGPWFDFDQGLNTLCFRNIVFAECTLEKHNQSLERQDVMSAGLARKRYQ